MNFVGNTKSFRGCVDYIVAFAIANRERCNIVIWMCAKSSEI